MEDLHITLIQSDLHWEDPEANLKMFAEKISKVGKTNLIILPEMFTTGFSMNPSKLAESMEGVSVSWMRAHAKAANAVICGSLMCSADGSFFNRLVWMRPDGSYEYYDKRHCFSMGQEDKYYSAGSKRLIVELKGWRVCPLICYDLRFPVWSRRTASQDYDLLLYVANWPERRAFAWKSLLVARAIENQSYVAAVNRIGDDIHGVYHSGDSAVYSPKGELMMDLKGNDVQTCVLSFTELIEFRAQFPAINDADEFRLQL
jgi:predicted amidohydrolase